MSDANDPSSRDKDYVPWSPRTFDSHAVRPTGIDGHGVGHGEGVDDAHDPSEEALSRFCVLSG